MVKEMLKVAAGVAAFYVIRSFLPESVKKFVS